MVDSEPSRRLAGEIEKQFNKHMMLARTNRQHSSLPASPSRRGECPTLARPMQTGDGLLARLRPLDNRLNFVQLRHLAEAAQRLGNGIIEITARGSLQIRGLRPDTFSLFEASVLASTIDVSTGIGIETPPLAGLDPDELIDVRPMAAELRRRIAAYIPALVLAPKLAITLDGGGRFHLGNVAADVKVTAFRDPDGVKFMLAAAKRVVAIIEQDNIVDAVIALLETMSAMGPTARGKDLVLPSLDGPWLDPDPAPLLGVHLMSPGDGPFGSSPTAILGIAFAYRQTDSASLIAFADAAEALGANDIGLAPGHGLFVIDLTLGQAQELRRIAVTLGFLANRNDPRSRIALCAGSRGCASAFYDTRDVAERLITHAPDLMDGSLDIHLSACPKGCAHPHASILTLVGARAGYGLVVNGAASASTSLYIAENDIDIAFARLQALVRQSKEDGESVSACLTRRGIGSMAAALQLDGT